jgi:tetratricopeptide (TPR) repeat protein
MLRLILLFSVIGIVLLSAVYKLSFVKGSEEYYYNRGLRFDEEENYDRAEEYFQRALKINPSLADAHLALGAIYLKTDELEDAERSILRALETLPRSGLRGPSYKRILSLAYNNLGVVEEKRILLAIARQDFQAAENHLTISRALYVEAMEHDPKNELAFYNWRRLPEQIITTGAG